MDERKIPALNEIKLKLQRLKDLDTRFIVFGASDHRYISYPLSDIELELFEAGLGVRLPVDYRQFLLEIGYGAGPYYGLFSPPAIFADLKEPHICGMEPGFPDPSHPFPFTREQAQECFQIMKEERPAFFEADWPTDGCIPICMEGCGFCTFLVTAGELTGSLWSHNPDWEAEGNLFLEEWNLVPQPPSIIGLHQYPVDYWHQALSPFPTFLEWYKAWLDQCLADFEELKNQDKKPLVK